MPSDTLSLAGKVAIVTGSGRENGIGAGIVVALARNGAAVTINYVSDSVTKRAHDLADNIKADGGRVTVVQSTVDTEEGAQFLVQETLKAFGTDHIDILVNNAGTGFAGDTLKVKPEEIAKMLDVNVKGPVYVAQAAIPHMPHGSRVINISSIAARLGLDDLPIYGACKAALDSLTWSWAKEFIQKSTKNTLVYETDITPASEMESSPSIQQKPASTPQLVFVTVAHPNEMKDRNTQRKISRHVMKEIGRSRRRKPRKD
ncbi:putative short chain type protein [Ilyonectria robusta]